MFARAGDEMRMYCEQAKWSVKEVFKLRTSCERVTMGWTP